MTRNALIIGIDNYKYTQSLNGCVNDATSLCDMLKRNEDGTKNFDVRLLITDSQNQFVSKSTILENCSALFKAQSDIALLYFAGHGSVTPSGGFLCASESDNMNPGIEMNDILDMANNSPSSNKIILLDCCHSGVIGSQTQRATATLNNGVTIITASHHYQNAKENNGTGIFTQLVTEALEGAAADLLGNITPAAIYNYVDSSLSWHEQRPLYKTNISHSVSIRKVSQPIVQNTLRKIIELFPTPSSIIQLDPSFEPTAPHPDKERVKEFEILQALNRVNIVIPVGADHMYFAAMESKSCRLTTTGKYYWKLVKSNKF